MKPLRILPPAEQEMLEAAQYYESQAGNLGIDFLEKIDSAFSDIKTRPEQWPVIERGVRRLLLSRFPYGVLYRIDPEEIVILAISHLHRDPAYWFDRIDSRGGFSS